MIKFIFSTLLLSTAAFAADFTNCLRFVGSYSRQIDNHDTFSSQGLKISADLRNSTLELTFNSDLNPRDWRGWIETYIADGNPHSGDSNTGKTYLASCNGDKISIHREGLLLKPLITEVTLTDDQLNYLSFAEGSEPHATFMQLKRVQ